MEGNRPPNKMPSLLEQGHDNGITAKAKVIKMTPSDFDKEMKVLRAVSSPKAAAKIKDHLCSILAHEVVNGKMTLIEGMYIKTVFELGLKRIFP